MFVVSGDSGFLGGAIAQTLSLRGRVTGLSRRGMARAGVDAMAIDLARPLPAMPGVQNPVVLHCAAEIRSPEWEAHWRGNVEATHNLLEWSVRHAAQRFIYISTGSVYGFQPRAAHECDPLRPQGYYAQTKRLGEEVCKSYAQAFSLELIIFRLYFPYGVGQKAGVFFLIDDALKHGKTLTVNSDGGMRFTPLAITDAVAALVAAAEGDTPPGTYNLCGDETISFAELVGRMEHYSGLKADVRHVDQTSSDMMGDNAALRAAGWRPRETIDSWLNKLYGG